MARTVSRSDFARIAGVSATAITKSCTRGVLQEACTDKRRIDLDHPAAQKYLLEKGVEPTTVGPLSPKSRSKASSARPRKDPKEGAGGKRKGNASAKAKPKTAKKAAAKAKPNAKKNRARPEAPAAAEEPPAPPALADMADPVNDLPDIDELNDMTIREVISRWGTLPQFADVLEARKHIAAIREKDLKNQEKEGKLIPREPIRVLVFGAIDGVNRRLLSDAPKTVVRRIYAMARSGVDAEEAEKVVRDILSATLAPLKTSARRVIRDA